MDAGGPALYVTAHFRIEPKANKAHGQRVAVLLALAIQQTRLAQSLSEARIEVAWNLLQEEIASVGVAASINGKDQIWCRSRRIC